MDFSYADVYNAWTTGVIEGPSGVRTPPVSTFIDKPCSVRWERDKLLKDGRTNRQKVTRYKAIVWLMKPEVEKLVKEGSAHADAVLAAGEALKAKYGSNKNKAYSAINKMMKAAGIAGAVEEDADE